MLMDWGDDSQIAAVKELSHDGQVREGPAWVRNRQLDARVLKPSSPPLYGPQQWSSQQKLVWKGGMKRL